MFDQGKTGFIDAGRVAAILNTLGQQFDKDELTLAIEEHDTGSSKVFVISLPCSITFSMIQSLFFSAGKLNFDQFNDIAQRFLEEQDDEAMQNELKEAFRLYDKEGI